MQGPGNQNRKNVTLKTNTDTGSCGSSWYSKKKLQTSIYNTFLESQFK